MVFAADTNNNTPAVVLAVVDGNFTSSIIFSIFNHLFFNSWWALLSIVPTPGVIR